ncbi:MAG: 23S rRNA (guanosine(2251)-2'-O)-methyltransferase RlmB [Bacilli bacterium]|nr:23S rRNA (guanosine(2251)-2'-O)-methyltransferase RlmB [Bacilli bacterium]
MFVCGRNVCEDMLKNHQKINNAILQDGFSDKMLISSLENAKIPIEYRSKKEMDHLDIGNHQGIILSIPEFQYDNMDILSKESSEVILVLDHIEDPHNFGAIMRTCEAAGINTIIIPQDRQVPVNATVVKTSCGTAFSLHIIKVVNIASSIEQLKKEGYWIVGTALENSVDYREIDYSGKIALVVGNEGNGMSDLVSKKCDFIAKIPMYGTTNSLNVSVATGIMIYEIIRNRK